MNKDKTVYILRCFTEDGIADFEFKGFEDAFGFMLDVVMYPDMDIDTVHIEVLVCIDKKGVYL